LKRSQDISSALVFQIALVAISLTIGLAIFIAGLGRLKIGVVLIAVLIAAAVLLGIVRDFAP
jgi:hypothetical protein